MKTNSKIIITAVAFTAVGLILGYIFFGTGQNVVIDRDIAPVTSEDAKAEEIWTCSMHPQIRQNEPGLCPICEMDLIPLGSGSSNDPLVLEMTREAVKLAQIETTVVGAENTTGKTIRLSGKVAEDERLSFSQVAHVPGRIEQLFVTFTGEAVGKGQKLATIYSPELVTAQRELLEAKKLEVTNPGLLEAARNKLRFWKISEKDIAAIEQNGDVSETFTLYADREGVVRQRNVNVGDYVRQGEVMFEMTDLSRVWVLFDAYERDLPYIKKGQTIEFTTQAIPGRTFKASVTFIDPVVDPKTRVTSVRTEVNNPGGILKPEMFVSGTYKQNKGMSSGLFVPKSAVLWTGRRSVVYVKVQDLEVPSFEYREVELGDDMGENYIVLGGLDEGDEVVTNGSFAIDAAAQLNNQASMMNQDVGVKGTDRDENIPDLTDGLPKKFKDQLSDISRGYLKLKDALVATDAGQAKEEAAYLNSSLEQVDMSSLPDPAHSFWMKQLPKLREHTELIMEKNDVEEQRGQFEYLSEAMISIVKAFGPSEDTLFVQHCPMAFDNTGADWLSDVREIRNPYFGNKMLKCGIVKKAISR